MTRRYGLRGDQWARMADLQYWQTDGRYTSVPPDLRLGDERESSAVVALTPRPSDRKMIHRCQ